MKKCPNCGREAERTQDWACRWCGYPLLSSGYRTLPKTFRQLQEERGYLRQPEVPEEEPAPPPEEAAPQLPPRAEAAEEETEERALEESGPALPEAEAAPPPAVRQEELPEPAPEEAEPQEEAQPAETERKTEPAAELPDEPETAENTAETVPESDVTRVPPREEEETAAEAAPPPAAAAPVPEIDTAAETVELNVRDLSVLYNSDKASVGEKLGGKTVRVTGTVNRVVNNSGLGIHYVLLTSNEPKSWNVRCTFNPEQSAALRRLMKGNAVTIEGKYAGYQRNIMLKDCFLVP